MLRNGVRIWEWRGEMMHAKTTVVDGRWTRVGSTDFNPLGIAINFELDAIVEDPARRRGRRGDVRERPQPLEGDPASRAHCASTAAPMNSASSAG